MSHQLYANMFKYLCGKFETICFYNIISSEN